MGDLVFWIAIFIMSLAVLVKSSDYFTASAEKIGIFFGIPSFVIGVTIVAVGTSLPELMSSIFAMFEGSPEIVMGNVVGSNIANILLILGITAIIAREIKVTHKRMRVNLTFLISSAFLLIVTVLDGVFGFYDAIIFLVALGVYIHHLLEGRRLRIKNGKLKRGENPGNKTWIILAVSCLFLYLGAKYTIESVIELSTIFNIGADIIAISAVALGTSLPELMVSLAAIKKKNAELAVGNVLGSNIFNTFAVMGVAGLIGPISISKNMLILGLPVMLIATFLYFFIIRDREMTRWEGVLMLLFYVLFLGQLFGIL